MSHGLINPDELPGAGLNLEAVSGAAADIRASGSAIQQGGADVASAWAALPLSYESTGAEAIYAAMTPVQTASDRVSGNLAALARALNDWVSAVQPILQQREALVDDAHRLHRDVRNFQPKVEATGNLAVSFMPVLVSNWWEDPDLVSRNNRLIGRGYLLSEKLRVADEDLANAIRRAAHLSTTAVVKAAKTAPDGLNTPWGDASAREESCAEKVVGFPAHFDLGILNGAWDLVGGLGMLTSGYDFKSWPPPQWKMAGDLLSGNLQQFTTDGNAWLSGWGQSWVGMGHLVTGLSMGLGGPLMTEVIMPGQISALKAQGADTSALEGMQQWERDSFTSEVDLFGGFVGYHAPQEWWKASGDEWGAGWSDWGDDPGGTGGKALFNVATLILPVKGGGAILDGLKAARIGVDGAEGAAGLADDAGRLTSSELSRAASDAERAAMRVDALAKDSSEFALAGDDLASSLGKGPLDDAGSFADHLRSDDSIVQHPVEPTVHPHAPEPTAPHVDAPEHAATHAGAETPAAPHGDVPDETAPPQIEPSDGHSGGSGEGGSAHEGAGGSLADRIAAGLDPAHSGAPAGQGWVHEPDLPITPKDLHYGEKLSGHGDSTYPTMNKTNSTTFDLVSDPTAPYGRFPDGTPLTKLDYDERYVFPDNSDNFPPNNGALRGTRVSYDNLVDLKNDYGVTVDRIGGDGGEYLGLRVDGVSAPFEVRSLPVSSLGKPLTNYEIGGSLPKGWRVEVSEIAPGVGRPGGGMQLRFLDDGGEVVPVEVLKVKRLLL